jgi:hypothetical protein
VFEWDARKATANRTKHGVSFEEESRFLRLGRAAMGRVLIVAYTVRRGDNGESIPIISARRASRKERAAYAGASRD